MVESTHRPQSINDDIQDNSNKDTNSDGHLSSLCEKQTRWMGRRFFLGLGLMISVLTALAVLTVKLIQMRRNNEMDSAHSGTALAGNAPVPIHTEAPSWIPPKRNPFTFSPRSRKPAYPPTRGPVITKSPTFQPVTSEPTSGPTENPTEYPTTEPTPSPSQQVVVDVTTFYAIGDVPYDSHQRSMLPSMMESIPLDAEFVIHVGDLRTSRDQADPKCRLSQYVEVANMLRLSPAPVFIILGDNDWNDCPNPSQGLSYWRQTFQGFESRYWNHSFQIQRCPDQDETFSFVHKNTLFFGLNLVGGPVLDKHEWDTRLTDQVQWVMEAMLVHLLPTVIFAHAEPREIHEPFFKPFRGFVQDVWKNRLPLLHLNGDLHKWEFNETFFNQSNWERITLMGGSDEPPVRMHVLSSPNIPLSSEAFVYDRFY